jgi:uncharacterized protein (TIGR02271 family)
MGPAGPIRVIGKDGLRGTVEAESRHMVGQKGEVIVQLDDGQRVLAPGDVLQRRDDGTVYLPMSRVDLKAANLTEEDRIVVPLVEEQLHVNKQQVESGGVRVSTHVHEREEVVDEPLIQEDVEVERVSVNRPVDGPVPVRHEGDTMIIPLLEEVLVVEKRLILREELRVTRRRTEIRDVQRVTLRREEGSVERLPSGSAADENGADRASSASS